MTSAMASSTDNTPEFFALYEKANGEFKSVSEIKEAARDLGWPLRKTDIYFAKDDCTPLLRIEVVKKGKQ